MAKLTSDDLKGRQALSDRNSLSDDPITRKQVKELRGKLLALWEDTTLVTFPNCYRIINVGNLTAILDTLLQGKGLVEEQDGERFAQDKLKV
jgi:hypothetical protein